MRRRIEEELVILRRHYPNLDFRPDGQWVKIPDYPVSPGWNRERTDVAFQIPLGYPGTQPYGIYVPSGIRFQATMPQNFSEPAGVQPPFGGTWGIFSWQIDGTWFPATQVTAGSNLWMWVRGFMDRFKGGI